MKAIFMDCKTCDALLEDYKYWVSLFKNAVRDTSGAFGDDSRLASEQTARLAQQCKSANEVLMAHWRKEHAPAVKISGPS